jgi:4-diphosphocytidyl-2C-methyl-D-erythritol kinase
MEEAIAAGDADRVIARLSNDFEEAIVPSEPPIAVAYDDLLMARARAAHLCGSGAAVFGVCLNEAVARETARLARLKHPNAVLCRTVPRSEALAGLTNI